MDEESFAPEYGKLSDENLALMAQDGDSAAEQTLVLRYMGLVRLKARPYFLVGADKADLIQEGSIGLLGAIREFDGAKRTGFRSFAEVCINYQLISAIKRSTRKKHQPLNNYISLDKSADDGGSVNSAFGDSIQSGFVSADPEALMINRENLIFLINGLQSRLTELERNVLALFLDGKRYAEISHTLGKTNKTVDNALQRIKKKLSKIIDEQNSAQ